jgi:hypothetical protein
LFLNAISTKFIVSLTQFAKFSTLQNWKIKP